MIFWITPQMAIAAKDTATHKNWKPTSASPMQTTIEPAVIRKLNRVIYNFPLPPFKCCHFSFGFATL